MEMRGLGTVSLTILAALAIAALNGAASASGDVICEEPLASTEEGEACEFPYDKGEELKAATSKVLLSGESFEVSCESSTTLVIGEDLGDEKGLTGKISAWTMSGCKGSCSKAAWAGLPYKATSTASTKGNGTLTVGALEKEPALNLEGCSLGGKCTYAAEKVVFSFTGGKPAKMEASKAAMKRTAGTVCPKEGSLGSTYEYQQPGGGRAYQAARNTPATVLCKIQLDPCRPATERYGAMQAIEAKVTGAGVEFKWNGAVENTCPVSVIKGTTETIAAPMLAKITEWKLENCGPCTGTSAARIPWSMSLNTLVGGHNGQFTVLSGGSGDPALEMTCGGVTCKFVREGFIVPFKGGDPATLELTGVTFTELGGGCGSMEIAGGLFQVEVPKPVWVETA